MKIIALVLLGTLLFSACMTVSQPSSEPAAQPAQAAAPAPEPGRPLDIPEFFLSPPILDDQFVGLGLARLSDPTLSRRTALARARADIATQVSVSVETMLVDYQQEAGAGSDAQALSFIEQTTKEVADIELQGAVTTEQYAAEDGTWFVMVYYPKDAIIEEVGGIFERGEGAAFAEFQAEQALERLNAEVENNPPSSAGVDSPVNAE